MGTVAALAYGAKASAGLLLWQHSGTRSSLVCYPWQRALTQHPFLVSHPSPSSQP